MRPLIGSCSSRAQDVLETLLGSRTRLATSPSRNRPREPSSVRLSPRAIAKPRQASSRKHRRSERPATRANPHPSSLRPECPPRPLDKGRFHGLQSESQLLTPALAGSHYPRRATYRVVIHFSTEAFIPSLILEGASATAGVPHIDFCVLPFPPVSPAPSRVAHFVLECGMPMLHLSNVRLFLDIPTLIVSLPHHLATNPGP